MAPRLESQPWMDAAPTRAVMAALVAAGGSDCARFVGGCVRNTLMGKPVDDVDIATTLHPDAVIEALTAAGLKHAPTGLAHGTVTAIAAGKPFEITTLRRDVSTDGRNATVAFTDDWAQDAGRRDFRFNALYADLSGEVFDPIGEGIADALAGQVIFVGDPQTRIREDYLRILRFFRFYAWYGRGEPDAAALAACAALKDGMTRLSAERVSRELLKLLAADNPGPAVELMVGTGVLEKIAPEARNLQRFAAVAATTADPLSRLAALLPDDAAVGRAVAGDLRLSNAMRERLIAALGPGSDLSADMSDIAARRILYEIGAEAFIDRMTLASLTNERLLALARTWRRPALPVTGADVAALGLPRGPMVGEVLREVEAWWLENDFPDDRRAALKKLSEVVASRG